MPPESASPEEYSRQAESLRREAEGASFDALRRQVLAMARGYEALATTAEMMARNRIGQSVDRGPDKLRCNN
jgi:hypothetical protein